MAAACGDGEDSARLSSGTAAALHGDVADARRAAESGDRDGALRAVDAFADTVTRAAREGRISAAELARFRRLLDQTRDRIAAEVAAPAAAPTVTAQPPAPREGNRDDEEGKGEPKGKGREEGKGNEKHEEGEGEKAGEGDKKNGGG